MKIKILDFGLNKEFTPRRAHYNDVGADVYSPTTHILYPGQTRKIGLKFGLELPDGMAGFIFPRSSMSAKGIVCELPPIDPGYRGEVHAVVSNISRETYTIKEGERVGQLVVLPYVDADLFYALDEAPRGINAFGSTGK